MTNEEYYKFKKLFEGGIDDKEVAMSGLRHTETSTIKKILLGKSLINHSRALYIKSFPEIKDLLKPWDELFTDLKELKPDKDEKVLIEKEFSDSFIQTIMSHHTIIKKIKFELKW
ncbi:MAG: hypothetical protein H8E16_18180 [Flavobacteriales bacterium]|nr:hypothetical protein [Flavobacteriales bacterium]